MLAALAGPDGPTMSRRSLLAGSAAATIAWALAGCTGDDGQEPGPSESGAPTPTADPDVPLRASVLDTADDLAGRYLATAVAHPDLTAMLSPLLADHRAHIAALTPPSTATPSASVSPTASTGVSTQPTASTPSGGPVPADPGEALDALRDGEESAAEVARSGAVGAADPALARLFASISASRSLHAEILDDQ